MERKDLLVEIVEVKGRCPVYQVRDEFYVAEGYKLLASRSCDVCLHAIGSIIPWAVSLSAQFPKIDDMGLGHEADGTAYVQCLDPGPPYTEGGTVTFAIRRVDLDNGTI